MAEDQRVLAQELEAQGWVRRFTIEAKRAPECVELYESLVDQVRVEPLTSELLAAKECARCLLADSAKHVISSTRGPDT
jgi:hypothetical protein